MNQLHRGAGVNAWWENAPAERYWLDVTQRDERDGFLACPRSAGRNGSTWVHRLITYVRGGDVVFRYDDSRRAIVGWAISHGRVERHDLAWSSPGTGGAPGATSRTVPSWGIRLREATLLDESVPLHEIARTQWDLFPTLRAMEDAADTTLHYPFEMGNRESTRPIAGYVFKLPAVFVRSFLPLSGAIYRVARLLPKRESEPYLSMELATHPLRTAR